MSKWDSFRASAERVHDDFFSGGRYEAEFFNTSQGTRDNRSDTYSGETRQLIGALQVEATPQTSDTSVRTEGTSFSWDMTIRFPFGGADLTVSDSYTVLSGETETYDSVTVEAGATLTIEADAAIVAGSVTNNGTIDNNGTFIVFGGTLQNVNALGEDNQKPTEVELADDVTDSTETYELHSYREERGSGMVMCRLVEQ
jgi:phage baseplate assembly protein gpV